MSERGLILIRTHFVDDRVEALARAYAAGGDYDVMIAADETLGEIDARGLPKLSMSLNSCARLGLHVGFNQPLWRCGDYVFYHALAVSRARAFWMVEYDVAINFADPLDFFRFFDARAREDFLCCCLEEAQKDWFWRKHAQKRFPVAYHALFPLVRLSAEAAQRLYARRRDDSERLSHDWLDPDKSWPNDEGFVASAAHETGLSMADFNAYGAFYTERSFAPKLILHRSELPPPDGRIYHACRTGAGYLKALGSYYLTTYESLLKLDDPEFAPAEFVAALAELICRRLRRAADDPSALFAPDGPLAAALPRMAEDGRVVEAVLRALGRLRLRLCVEALQFGRLALPLAPAAQRDNLALGRPAWQSSTSRRSRKRSLRREAEGGNDGYLRADPGFLTAQEEAPWWAVDLGEARAVRLARLYNRRGFERRLRQFVIETSPDGVAWTVRFAHAEKDVRALMATPVEVAFDPPVAARYWRVRLARRGVLHLTEVELVGG